MFKLWIIINPEVVIFHIYVWFSAPAPSNVQSVLATKCLDHKQDKTQTFYVRPNGGCDRIDELHGPDAIERHLTDKNVVFAFQVYNIVAFWIYKMIQWNLLLATSTKR